MFTFFTDVLWPILLMGWKGEGNWFIILFAWNVAAMVATIPISIWLSRR